MKRLLKPRAYLLAGLLMACQSQPDVPQSLASEAQGADASASARSDLSAPPKEQIRIPATLRGPKGTRRPDAVRWAVPLDPTSPTRGSGDDALVTLILFEDLESPFSRHLYPTLERLFEEYKHPLRLSYRHLPLPHNKHARTFAHAAHCAHEQGRFWALRDALMTATSTELPPLLENVQLDMVAYTRCMGSSAPERRVNADAQAAQRASVGGTPVLFVNGRKSAGSISYTDLNALVEEERLKALERAKAQSQAESRGRLYDVITKNGRTRSVLAPVPTPVAEIPVATLGDANRLVSMKVWLDLSHHDQRQSLKALIDVARDDKSVSLEVFALPDKPANIKGWRARLSCAKSQGKEWPMLEAATAATRHSAGHPMEHVDHDEDHHDTPDPLDTIVERVGLDTSGCAPKPPQGATFNAPTLLVNGRRYDGSLGWGPAALRRLRALVAPSP